MSSAPEDGGKFKPLKDSSSGAHIYLEAPIINLPDNLRCQTIAAPLVNFAAHKPMLQVDESLSIELVPESDRQSWLTLEGAGAYMSFAFQKREKIWQVVKKQPRADYPYFTGGAFTLFLDALRIIKAGHVELVLVISQAQDRSITVIHPQSLLFGPQYEIISDDEESRLGKVWGLLAGGAASRIQGLQMALEFWRVAATYADRPHYALLFTVMALEALCAKDAGDPRYRNEIRYRFTQRLGALLGTGVADKKRIIKEMGQCYDLRSSLAHGDQANEAEAKTLLPLADRTLRDTVNRFLESGKPRDWNDVIFGVPTVS
jgi:hypothetical protein